MQPLFDAGGWSLPTEIIPQEHTKKKKQKQKPISASNEADQLQQQLTKVHGKQQKKQQQPPAKRKHAADTEQQQQSPPTKKQKGKQKKNIDDKKTGEKVAEQDETKKDVVMQDVQDTPTEKPAKESKKNKRKQQQQQNATEEDKQTKQPIKNQDEQASQPVNEQKQADSKQQKKDMKDTEGKKNAAKKNTVSEQQRKKLQELLSKKNVNNGNNNNNNAAAPPATATKQEEPAKDQPAKPTKNAEKPSKLTALQQKMKDKLSGARFRWLNEQLYTTRGSEAYKIFNEKPELFDEYHEGFRHQVESWPVNPVDVIIDQLKELPKGTVVADLGCGDAKIAHTVTHLSVLSFDLVAKNDKVIACDIAKLPIPANFVDVAVFSLSLMGTNYLDFLDEAKRVLKSGGELKIAEVVSRFSDVNEFIHLVELLGFNFEGKDDTNKMFIMLYFTKLDTAVDEEIDKELLEGLDEKAKRKLKEGAGVSVPKAKLKKKAKKLLKPCVYKKR